MSKPIIDYFLSLNHTIRRDDVYTHTEDILSSISETIIPALDKTIREIDKDDVKDSKLLDNIRLFTDIKAANNYDVLIRIKELFVEIHKYEKDILKLVKDNLSIMIIKKTAKGKDAAILKFISDIGSMTMFVLDLVFYVLLQDDDTAFPKLKKVKIAEVNSSFSAALDMYHGNIKETIHDIANIKDVYLEENMSKLSMLVSFFNGVDLPMTTEYVNNPIYHIRMWMVDNDMDSLEVLKEKKKLTELKIAELKTQDKKAAKKQIEYYEEKVANMEYMISQIEDNN